MSLWHAARRISQRALSSCEGASCARVGSPVYCYVQMRALGVALWHSFRGALCACEWAERERIRGRNIAEAKIAGGLG